MCLLLCNVWWIHLCIGHRCEHSLVLTLDFIWREITDLRQWTCLSMWSKFSQMVIISRRPIGPWRKIIKRPPSFCQLVRPSVHSSRFRKTALISFTRGDRVTKLSPNIYGYIIMSTIHFGLILKNKMAAIGDFPFLPLIFQHPILLLCYCYSSQLCCTN